MTVSETSDTYGALLEVSAINVKIGQSRVLRGVSLKVQPGERVAIMGPSGSGKSTLLYAAVGLIRPQSGAVYFRGRELSQLTDRQRSAWRRESVGFVFQFGHLIHELTITENVEMPLLVAGSNRADARARSNELISQFGLSHISARYPDQVSGGELQRVAVARAAAARPPLIVADEPTGALDTKSGESVLELLDAVTGPDAGAALVMVTHDPAVAARADRVIALRDGHNDRVAVGAVA